MHRPHRWLWAFALLFAALLALLLLSSLIETPADASTPPAPLMAPVMDAAFLSAAMPSLETAPQARVLGAVFLSLPLWAFLTLALPLRVAGRDANGRVLRRRRYARSFYPLFRLQLACG